MGGMEIIRAKPRGILKISIIWLHIHSIFESTLTPLIDAVIHIVTQAILVATPHASSWMIDPTLGLAGEGVKDLEALDTLLAKALVIKAFDAFAEAWVWEEGLND